MMNNRYYEPFDNNTNNEGGQTPAYRTELQQTAYTQNAGYAPHQRRYANPCNASHEPKGRKKKTKKSAGFVAGTVAACVMMSGVAGFGGSYLFSKMNAPANNTSAVQVNKTNTDNNSVSNMSVQQTDKSTNQIVSEVADSVVEIAVEVVQSNPFYGESVAQGAGSGVIISEDGYILTNNHVIDGASKITVSLRSGESYDATLIGTDPDVDIALVKIEASGLSAAPIGDSSAIKPGDKSVIIGNPLGTLGGSVTEGIVSAVDRTLDIDGKTMHLMQTDAAVNPGNSGGGMFNGQGDRGKASTGMAYSEGSDQSYEQYLFGMSGNTSGGVYVASVKTGSNAEKAGFQVGDRVLAVDGKEITTFSDLKSVISEHSVGDTLSFELERNGRTGTLQLTLEEYSPTDAA